MREKKKRVTKPLDGVN